MPVYELRTYHVTPGKMADLKRRFVDHGLSHLKKHGIEVVSFWERDTPGGGELIYVCKFDEERQVKERWERFRADPTWIAAKSESEKNGMLTTRVDSVVMRPADFWQPEQ
jgi:hypothetical protein